MPGTTADDVIGPQLSAEVLDSDETYFAQGGFLPGEMLRFWEAFRRPRPTAAAACSAWATSAS